MICCPHVLTTIKVAFNENVSFCSVESESGAAKQYKSLNATFATIVGKCAFASRVIIGWICEVSSTLLHTSIKFYRHLVLYMTAPCQTHIDARGDSALSLHVCLIVST